MSTELAENQDFGPLGYPHHCGVLGFCRIFHANLKIAQGLRAPCRVQNSPNLQYFPLLFGYRFLPFPRFGRLIRIPLVHFVCNCNRIRHNTASLQISLLKISGDVPSVPLARAGGRERQRSRPQPGQFRRPRGLQPRRGWRRRLLDLLRSVSAQLFIRVLPAAP